MSEIVFSRHAGIGLAEQQCRELAATFVTEWSWSPASSPTTSTLAGMEAFLIDSASRHPIPPQHRLTSVLDLSTRL